MPTKDATNNRKERKAQNPPPIVKDPIPEVREIIKPLPPLALSMKFRKSESLYPFQS
jgi:hypothetical protein